MKYFSMIFIFALLLPVYLHAQDMGDPTLASDSIIMEKHWGTAFYIHNERATVKQVLETTKPHKAAYKEMKIARRNYDYAVVIGFMGGFIAGWPLGSAIAGGDPTWALVGVGAGLITISIPFLIKFNKHAKKAVDIYNAGLYEARVQKPHLNLSFAKNGLGLVLKF